jgi:dephospho-CoA kinase
MTRIILGLAGQIGAGKQEAANYLRTRRFLYFSLSDAVRDEARRRGIKVFTRKNLQDVGDDLRKKFGLAILAKRIHRKIMKTKSKKVVIDSIRNPAEVNFLRGKGEFFLIGVKAKRRIRFERVRESLRETDVGVKRWREFLRADRRDWGVRQKSFGQQVGEVMSKADFIIDNNKGLKELYEQIERILVKILKE